MSAPNVSRLNRPGLNANKSVNALDNEQIKIDFRPLYQCIHIYEALDAKTELQRNYQDDRKVGINCC